MSVEFRVAHLAAAFHEGVIDLPGGRVFRPPAPVNLVEALGPSVTARLERERIGPLVEFGHRATCVGRPTRLGLLEIGSSGGLLCLTRHRCSPLASNGHGRPTVMQPSKKFYPQEQTPIAGVDYWIGLREDLYLVLGDFARDGSHATVKVQVNRLVTWIWIGGLVITLGTFLALVPDPRRTA